MLFALGSCLGTGLVAGKLNVGFSKGVAVIGVVFREFLQVVPHDRTVEIAFFLGQVVEAYDSVQFFGCGDHVPGVLDGNHLVAETFLVCPPGRSRKPG